MATVVDPTKKGHFDIGDKIPYGTLLQMVSGKRKPIFQLMGKSFVLFYFLKIGHSVSNQLLAEFKKAFEEFKQLGIDVYGLSPASPEQTQDIVTQLDLPFQIFSDEGLLIGRQLGLASAEIFGSIERVEAKTTIFLIDGTLRVRHIIDSLDPSIEIQKLLEEIPHKLLYKETAPILKVPFAFNEALCENLLDIFIETHTGEGDKIPAEHRALTENLISLYLSTRILPCVHSAFRYTPLYQEAPQIIRQSQLPKDYILKVNDLPAVRHREFALLIPLKMDTQEGAEIEFLEYGPTQYHLNIGEALIFSCDLLHKFLSSKKGEVFWFMTFFHREPTTSVNNTNNPPPQVPDALF